MEMNKNSILDKFTENNIFLTPVIKLTITKEKGEWKKKPTFPVAWQKPPYNQNLKDYSVFGMITGKVNNLTVVDIDTKDFSLINPILKDLNINKLDDVPCIETKKGFHLYYNYTDKLGQTQGYGKEKYGHDKIDIRNNNGCAFCPPSIYKVAGETIKYQLYNISLDDFVNKISRRELPIIPDTFFIEKSSNKKENKEAKVIKPKKDKQGKIQYKELSEINKKYLALIPADNRDDWFQVGCVLNRLGCSQEVWNEWSKTSPKYNEEDNNERWHTLSKYNYNEKTLEFKAYQYNRHKARYIKVSIYEKIVDTYMKSQLEYDMASFIHRVLQNLYCIDESQNKKTFIYPNEFNKWQKINTSQLGKLLSTTCFQVFMDRHFHEYEKLSSIDTSTQEGNEEYKKHEAYCKALRTASASLKTTKHKNSYIKQLTDLSFEDGIVDKLDEENLYLLNFDNGAYDLKNSRFILPDVNDFVSKTTGYEYTPEVDEEIRKEIFEVFDKIYKDETDETHELRDYNFKIMASSLCGLNKYEAFYVDTGSGGNGKGVKDYFCASALGEYYDVIDKTFFTQAKKSSSQAEPELAGKKGVRMLVSTETEKNEEFQVSKIKLLTGNDKISTRGLFQNQTSFTPQFMIAVQCNGCPNLSQVEGGVKRRFVLIEYPTRFVKNPRKNERYEEKKDPSLKEKIKTDVRYRQQFILILIEYYNKYIKDDNSGEIEMPQMVRDYTDSFLFDNDELGQFFKELNMEVTGIKTDKIKISHLWTMYKTLMDNGDLKRLGRNEFYKMVSTYDNIKRQRQNTGDYFIGLKVPNETYKEYIK
jgi:P4 family phage/plasmid primase-like protien